MPPKKLLKDYTFALSGTLTESRSTIEKEIKSNGGKTASSVTAKVTHLLSTALDVAAAPAKVKAAQSKGVPIVAESFLRALLNGESAKVEDHSLSSDEAKSGKRKQPEPEAEKEDDPPKKKSKKESKKASSKGKGKKKKDSEETKESAEEEPEEPPTKKQKGKKAAPKKGKGKNSKKKSEPEVEAEEEPKKDDEKEEPEEPPTKKAKGKKAAPKKGKGSKKKAEPEVEEEEESKKEDEKEEPKKGKGKGKKGGAKGKKGAAKKGGKKGKAKDADEEEKSEATAEETKAEETKAEETKEETKAEETAAPPPLTRPPSVQESPLFDVSGKAPKVAAHKYNRGGPHFPDDFTIIKNCVLQVTDIKKNNNKYYALELHQAGVQQRLFTHYGRTDDFQGNPEAGVKEVRYYSSLDDAKRAYNQLYNEKTSKKKGYKPVDLFASNIGSHKARGQSVGHQDAGTRQRVDDAKAGKLAPSAPVVEKKVVKASSTLSQQVQELVNYLYSEATQSLTQRVNVTITKKGIETPLGILTLKQIEKGEQKLAEIHKLLTGSKKPSSAQLEQLSGEFFTIIPHRLGRSREDVRAAVIKELKGYTDKMELLQLMKDMLAVSDGKSTEGNVLYDEDVDARYKALGCEIEFVAPSSKEYKELYKYLLKTANSGYGAEQTRLKRKKEKTEDDEDEEEETSDDLGYKVLNVYKVTRENEIKRFTKKIKNEHLLYHGSRICNYVGLLSRGILMPQAVTALGVRRTDFGWLGAGIYFGDCYPTSAQYCVGGIRGTRFYLLANVALGKWTDQLLQDGSIQKPPAGYDSLHGNPDADDTEFSDHEWCVYNENQEYLKYIVEFQ